MGRLLDKAKNSKVRNKVKRRYDPEQTELAIAYTLGEISHSQTREAMDYRSKNMLAWSMSVLRAAADAGHLEITLK